MIDNVIRDLIRQDHNNWNSREIDLSGERKSKEVQSSPTITPQLQSCLMSYGNSFLG